MNAQQIVEGFRALGISVSLVDDRVRLAPASQAPVDLIEALKERKPEVVAFLQHGHRPVAALDADQGQPTPPNGANAAPASPFARNLFQQLLLWAGDDVHRWRRIHGALISIYAPVWDRTDERDILVMWVAARLGCAQARRELARLQTLRQPLTGRDADAKAARLADISFWQRVAGRHDAGIPAALTIDVAAAKVMRQVVQRKA